MPEDQQDRILDQQAKRYRQVQELNQEPLNQAALKWVRKISDPDGWAHPLNRESQYVIQLMQWGLEKAGLRLDGENPRYPNPEHTEMFRTYLMEFDLMQNQHKFLRFLQGPPEEPMIDAESLLSEEDPTHAAWRLIAALDTQLSNDENFYESYPPINPVAHLLPSWNKI